jgi:hypothetical protein
MSDEPKSAWDKVLSQITDPWDWAAAAVGAAGGLGVTVATHGADLGASAALGASSAIGARKAWVASRQRARLLMRAEGIEKAVIAHYKEVDERIAQLDNSASTDASSKLKELDKLQLELETLLDTLRSKIKRYEDDHTADVSKTFAQALDQISKDLDNVIAGTKGLGRPDLAGLPPRRPRRPALSPPPGAAAGPGPMASS